MGKCCMRGRESFLFPCVDVRGSCRRNGHDPCRAILPGLPPPPCIRSFPRPEAPRRQGMRTVPAPRRGTWRRAVSVRHTRNGVCFGMFPATEANRREGSGAHKLDDLFRHEHHFPPRTQIQRTQGRGGGNVGRCAFPVFLRLKSSYTGHPSSAAICSRRGKRGATSPRSMRESESAPMPSRSANSA